MVKRNRKDRTRKRRGTRKNRAQRRNPNRKQNGGGWGFTGASSIPGTPGTVSNPMVYTGIGDCRAERPGYEVPYSSYAKYQGLPGMNGGKRSRRNRRNRKTLKGGRYTFDLAATPGITPNGATPWAGTYPSVQRIACEGSTPNPLNPPPHTPSTQPLPVATSALGLNPQSGGAQLAPATYGVGDVDSMYYYGPTAGYDNKPSTWVDSVGAPVQLQIPFAARAMNPACLTTGHPPPLTGANAQNGGGLSDALGALAGTFTGAASDIRNTTVGLVRDTATTALSSGQQLATTGANVGKGIVLTATGRGGQVGGKRRNRRCWSRRSRKHGGDPLSAAASVLGNVVRGTTGTMASAVTGVAGATGTLIQGTTGATANAALGMGTTLGHLGQGALNTGRAVLKGGKNRKNRKASRKNRKH
jgi:hypothetical protein